MITDFLSDKSVGQSSGMPDGGTVAIPRYSWMLRTCCLFRAGGGFFLLMR
jgi:hypothetical protein